MTSRDLQRLREAAAEAGGMSVAEAAKFTSLGRTTLYQLMDSGLLPYAKVGGRRVVLRAALVRLLAEATPAS